MILRSAVVLAIFWLGACASVQETPESTEEVRAATPPPEGDTTLLPPAVVSRPTVSRPPAPVVPPRTVAPPEHRTSEVENLLAEFERLRRLAPTELPREQEAARLAHVQSKTDAARVRLAMALTVPGSPPSEEARALELLEPMARNPSSPLHGIAFLLSALIQEQRRVSAQLSALQQANQGLAQNNQALQQNLHGLQQKLDALRTLERSLTERGDPPQRRR